MTTTGRINNEDHPWPNKDGSVLSISDCITHLVFVDDARCCTERTHTWVIGQPNDERQASAP